MKVGIAAGRQNDFIDGALGTPESRRATLRAKGSCRIGVRGE